LGVAFGADLADEHQVIRVGVQCRVDQLVGDADPVVVRGVDVVDPCLDGQAKHRQGRVPVARGTPDPWPGKLHGAKADARYGPPGKCGAAAGWIGGFVGCAHLRPVVGVVVVGVVVVGVVVVGVVVVGVVVVGVVVVGVVVVGVVVVGVVVVGVVVLGRQRRAGWLRSRARSRR